MKLPARLYGDLIGKPFEDGGRGPGTFDCLGLAIEMQRRQGRAVGNYASTIEEFHREYSAGLFGPCAQLCRPAAGCVVLLRTGIHERHVGTMLDAYTMLHTMSGMAGGAAIERLLAPEWTRRVLGYYLPVEDAL